MGWSRAQRCLCLVLVTRRRFFEAHPFHRVVGLFLGATASACLVLARQQPGYKAASSVRCLCFLQSFADSREWFLTRDTLAILDSNTPVLVGMETLRRATIYARQGPQVAKGLISRLQARAANSDAARHPDALAWFDAGYLAEAYKQLMGNGD